MFNRNTPRNANLSPAELASNVAAGLWGYDVATPLNWFLDIKGR